MIPDLKNWCGSHGNLTVVSYVKETSYKKHLESIV